MDSSEPEFQKRRVQARERLDRLTGAAADAAADRQAWFHAVYETAGEDAAQIPWAALAAHPLLAEWLLDAGHSLSAATERQALDVACGLGDNAEALAQNGWRVTAFDLVPQAIAWARRRFPESPVTYRVADLFAPPAEWAGGFDLVHECYTLQAMQGEMRRRAFAAVADLVKPGGLLLVIARICDDDGSPDGPPWPLSPGERMLFAGRGLRLLEERYADVGKPDGRVIPHCRMLWSKRQ